LRQADTDTDTERGLGSIVGGFLAVFTAELGGKVINMT